MDTLKVKRQQRLRRAILEAAESAKAQDSGVDGRTLADCLESLPPRQRPVDDDEIIGLARDLVHLSLLKETDMRSLAKDRFCLDTLCYSITAKGTGLLSGVEPKEPLVDDERI